MKAVKRFFTVLLIACILLAAGAWFFTVDRWLVRSDAPEKSDLIVVLLGSIPDRILGAVDLYQKDYAPQILMAATNKQGYDILVQRGVHVPIEETLNAEIARQLGVPEKATVILPGQTRSTQDEAVVLRDYLAAHPEISSLILVTSKYHSGRASVILEKAFSTLDHPVRLLSCPTPYDEFNARKWWANRNDMKYVVEETLKYIHFYLIEQFELVKP